MKVKYIGNNPELDFVSGEVYEVISIERGWYRILDPLTKDDYLFPPEEFEIINNNEPLVENGWCLGSIDLTKAVTLIKDTED